MILRSLVPRSIVRYFHNKAISKGLRGVVISYEVDLNKVELSDFVNLAHHVQISNSTIGARTSVGRYSKINHTRIGKYCSISWDVTIGAISHPMHSISSHAFSYRKQFGLCQRDQTLKHEYVTIGNDVWIGSGVIIMPGKTIGHGAIVGGGSVVTHSVLDYEIVAGCPARHIGWRFEETIREKLLQIKWWDFSDETIRNNIALFSPYNDITKDIEIINKLNSLKQ